VWKRELDQIWVDKLILLHVQLCGVRGGGGAAAQSIFWQARRDLSFILAFESIRERNVAIMLARRYAFDCNVSNSVNSMVHLNIQHNIFTFGPQLGLIWVANNINYKCTNLSVYYLCCQPCWFCSSLWLTMPDFWQIMLTGPDDRSPVGA